MRINPHTLLFAAVAAESSGLGKAGGASTSQATPPPPAADPAKKREMTPSDLEARLNPEARKVLQERLARKAGKQDTTITPPADDAAAKAAAEAALVVPPPAIASDKPKDQPKPGDDVKITDETQEGVIDFTKLKPETPTGEDGAPAALTEAELADLSIVRKKLEEAHKDNAAQRKLKRELKEAKEKLEADNKALADELENVRAQASTKPAGASVLDRYTSVKDVEAAKADAIEALRQLQEQPERDWINLPGRQPWRTTDAQGNSIAAKIAETAFAILEGFDGKVKQLSDRTAAEQVVTAHLPLLTKAVPEIEKSYKELLASDWTSRAPEISLDAALGKLVRTGQYVMMPAGKPAAKTAAAPKTKDTPKPDLPSTPPPVREAKAGEADVSALKKRAFEGDQKALAEWIKRGGKTSRAA